MTKRYFIQLAYNGANYHGWQIQPKDISVQEVLQKALSLKLNDKIDITGAGRTDTGVHSSYFVAHFDTEKEIPQNLVYQLNNFLPNDISIKKISEVHSDAHARFDATYRIYKYYISTEKNPFNDKLSLKILQKLDLELMNKACKVLYRHTDFTSFSKLHTDTKTNNCKIELAKWEQNGSEIIFTIKADRFLRNMVRAIVGTMLEIGKNKIAIEEFDNIITQKNRSKAGHSAKGHALFLVDIGYDYF